MKIHLYLREFPAGGDPLNSGMIKAVHGLAAGLAGCGAEVTILCEGRQTTHTRVPAGYQVRCFGAGEKGPALWSQAPELGDYLQRLSDPGLFILNGVFSPCVASVARALRQAGIPYVHAPHDPYHPSIFRQRRLAKWLYWRLLERPMIRRAAAAQVLDRRHEAYLRKLGLQVPVIEVVNGLEASDVHPVEELNWTASGPIRLLFLGRMDAHNKGLDLLLQAFAELKNAHPATLTLQGPDWGDLERMKHLARRLGLEDCVQFRPPQFDRNASRIAAEYDIFCMPSRFEGFGLSALEAMLAGRVIMISDVAGLSPHVRAAGCGVVCDSTVASVLQSLNRLIESRGQWKTMGLAGRDYAIQRLQWPAIARGALEQYRQLLSTAAAAGSGERGCVTASNGPVRSNGLP